MPEIKKFETETTTKTREIIAPASTSSFERQLFAAAERTARVRETHAADYTYPGYVPPPPTMPPWYGLPIGWWRRSLPTPIGVPSIKKVVFNAPATIVFWGDGSKTIVKCQPGDTYSRETGLAMAIVKKTYGNKGNYNNVFRKWVPKDE